jgi:hypothetical protein
MFSVTAVQQEALAAEKAKRKRQRGELVGRDLRSEEPAVHTAVDDQAEGHRAAMAEEAARKAFADRGISEGSGRPTLPGHVEAEDFRRGYLEAGRCAESPMAEPPRTNPVPAPYGRGVPVPIALPGAAVAASVPAHITQALSMGSPSDR